MILNHAVVIVDHARTEIENKPNAHRHNNNVPTVL